MTAHQAIGLAEGFIEAESEEQVIEAWQYLLDVGLVWQLQGWFGRTAVAMIEDGILEVKDAEHAPETIFVQDEIEMVWTILGQDKISGKLETFVLMTDGANSKQKAFDEASETVEVLAVIQGNHKGSVTLYKPYSRDLALTAKTEAERMEDLRFMRCSEYWEGI